ncbi:nitronate monooxygenase [Pseudonocardia sp. GCM10023141]|uniref:nitronate monooxygenase n=1 Tax=Pseudonocardia sp. GCM10023141 TaxID=3252653 RepID=UPI003617C860
MHALLSALGATSPVLAAPMAGGPSSSDLVTAAGAAGSVAFVAGGYKPVTTLAEQIATVRAAAVPFGVNLFAPPPIPVDPAAFHRYAEILRPEFAAVGLAAGDVAIVEDDDGWATKIELLVSDPVPLVSFTFGIPDASVIAALRAKGTVLVQTVTSVAEAQLAAAAGVDALAVQASAAGGHSGTLSPEHLPAATPIVDLIAEVRAAVSLPLIAAGGLATPAAIAEVLGAGAAGAMVGTVLLRADESGASAPHKAALADVARAETVITSAFTGRPARALRNGFTDRYTVLAPAGYPALHHLTSPMRKAAVVAGDVERIHLWAGTGHRHATAEPVGQILARLAGDL